jgi:hypothetical protein
VNWHPTEDDLILHYYREHAELDARRIDDHLKTCAACDSDWRQMGATMDALDGVVVPEPDAAFESRLWSGVEAARPPRSRNWTLRQVVMVGSWAAVVGLIAGAGLTWRAVHPPSAGTPAVAADASEPVEMRERVLLTALNDHFSQTEMLLVEVMNGPNTPAERQFERLTADDLVLSGRLYRDTARDNGDVHLAAMLDDIEDVLADIANAPERPDARQALRARIEDDDLLFKVRAVTTEVRGRRRALMP